MCFFGDISGLTKPFNPHYNVLFNFPPSIFTWSPKKNKLFTHNDDPLILKKKYNIILESRNSFFSARKKKSHRFSVDFFLTIIFSNQFFSNRILTKYFDFFKKKWVGWKKKIAQKKCLFLFENMSPYPNLRWLDSPVAGQSVT